VIPEHCSNVAVVEVDFPLTRDSVRAAFEKRQAYVRTDFAIFRRGKDTAVARIRKQKTTGLFRPVDAVEVLSLPDSTVFLEDPKVDVMNANSLASAAAAHPGKTVVVEGEFGHVNFIHHEAPVSVLVFDWTPPEPAKLTTLVARALTAFQFGRPVLATYEGQSLNALGDELAAHRFVYFPCKTAGLSACAPATTRYLDQPPQARPKPEEAAVVGCELSLRIFGELFGGRPAAFTEICPVVKHPEAPEGAYLFVKCCKVKPPFERSGNLFAFPWGVQLEDIVAACTEIAGVRVPGPRPQAEGIPGVTPLRLQGPRRPRGRQPRSPRGRRAPARARPASRRGAPRGRPRPQHRASRGASRGSRGASSSRTRRTRR
jgi:hypothetical protein